MEGPRASYNKSVTLNSIELLIIDEHIAAKIEIEKFKDYIETHQAPVEKHSNSKIWYNEGKAKRRS